ncbi:MAG TPA: histidine kinase dimerization/phospho-acceptor domain-containing protein, partial [Rhizobacter sp.]|nr:histidine kinase dimerization/phospho-acceptor domain-containing protein [Rhizobacter sp.]
MTRLIVVALSAVGLILFVTFVAARLVRSRLRGISIRMQVFVALALIVGAFAFGLGVLVVDRVEARAVRLAQATAHDEAEAVAAILQSEMERTGVPFSVMAVQLGRSLRPTARPAQARKERGWDLETTGLELLDEQSVVLYPPGTQSRARDAGALVVDAPLIQNGRTLGTVRVVKPVIVVQALLADFAPTVLVISLLLGAVAAFAAAWIGRAIAAPLEALSDYAERVSQGERSQLPKRVSGREVLRLVQSIGTLQRKLEGRPFVETFAADLSHELKNPVAAIRASAEVLEDGALEDAPQARHFVGRIREAAGRIEKLLAELLHLAQVETRGAENLARVELNELSERVLAALENDRERVTIHAAR